MSCPEITIDQVDQALYDKLLAEADAAGMKFEGNSASIMGCTFFWSYDAASQTLHAQCMKKPIYIPCDTITGKIQKLIAKARNAGL